MWAFLENANSVSENMKLEKQYYSEQNHFNTPHTISRNFSGELEGSIGSVTINHIILIIFSCMWFICFFQVNVAHLLIKSHVPPQNIAILTPYNAQMSEIKKTMQERNITNVTVCTIMKSQGVLFWLHQSRVLNSILHEFMLSLFTDLNHR